MKKSLMTVFILISASLAISACVYQSMPEQMASHWNAAGDVDGYLPRFLGVFMMPVVSLFMLGLFLVVPKVDPLKANIEKFRDYYDKFILLMVAFLFYIHALTLAWNLGFEFGMGSFVVPAIGVIIYYAGVLMENAKRNWFIGIRTPWTLSSDKVWDRTHKLGSRLFKIAGALMVIGLLFPEYLLVLVAPVVVFSLYLIVYSYLEYKKEVAS